MKNIILFSLLCITSLSCHKEKLGIYEAGAMTYGKAEAKINGKCWEASAIGEKNESLSNPYFGIIAGTNTEEGFQREGLYISEIPLQIGHFPVEKNVLPPANNYVGASFYVNKDDGDILEAYYELDDSEEDNSVTVDELDLEANIVKGTFDLTFLLKDGYSDKYPKKVKLKNGVFEVKLVE